ncbi:hypothetical protein [Micromonospora sp. NPDC051141]|uniref:hypothetical protein n=1 Tax=Micromonospora sp. NPDC051141 TaxID=3364284 RepID=UPI00379475E2
MPARAPYRRAPSRAPEVGRMRRLSALAAVVLAGVAFVGGVTLGDVGPDGRDGSPAPAALDAVAVAGVSPGAGWFQPVSPRRLLDTRNGTSLPEGKLGPGETRLLTINNGVTTDVTAVTVTVTAVGSSKASSLLLYPAGEEKPTAATLSFAEGMTVSTTTTVKLGTGRTLAVFNESGSTHVLLDLQGYFRPLTGPQGYLGWARYVNGHVAAYHTPDGNVPSVSRTSTGRYAVSFPGISTGAASVQITAHQPAGTPTNCLMASYPTTSSTSNSYGFRVACTHSVTGAAVDSGFFVEVKA